MFQQDEKIQFPLAPKEKGDKKNEGAALGG
jgi:hypothetical protein